LKLLPHPEKCTGCRICEIICSTVKENIINPKKARIRIVTVYPGTIDYPVVCKQCEKPPCVAACPVGAINVDEKTKAVLVNSDACIGCESCVNACPYSAIAMHPHNGKKLAVICDLCGGEPACVKWCPSAAIELIP
jgi:Fe-S-cluster-containing hydrogenase component 2